MCEDGNITMGNVILKKVCDIFYAAGNIRELFDSDDKVRYKSFVSDFVIAVD